VITLDKVSKSFTDDEGRTITAVADVSLQVADGETLSLIGTSGSGKTTTLKLINRLIEPTAGRIAVDGEDVLSVDVIALRRRMGYVIQTGGLFPHMTVRRNIGLLCELEHWPAERTTARVDELLTLVNLPPDQFAERHPRDLSGGQRQRVGVARALALDPPIILMDEPFGALDPITRDQLHGEFRQLEAQVKKTIILVTHDLAEAFVLSDRVAIMNRGRVVQVGTERELRGHPATPFVERFLQGHLGDNADG
jgi:osmoprotectant transport system ATP-binding protein